MRALALARQTSPRLAVAAAVAQPACRSLVVLVVPVAPVAPAALACLSVRDHPVVAVAVARRLVVPAVLVVPVHQLAVLVGLVGLVVVRTCWWCHGSRVARQRSPDWLTVAG